MMHNNFDNLFCRLCDCLCIGLGGLVLLDSGKEVTSCRKRKQHNLLNMKTTPDAKLCTGNMLYLKLRTFAVVQCTVRVIFRLSGAAWQQF